MGGMSEPYVEQVMQALTRSMRCFLDGRLDDMINRSEVAAG